ncbi:MAG: nitroreductase family deazaflavin-dependent oxidoreductase, partial [Acidimicrobiia bacterium]|nr:nitroreductase family deazaflavin-dependent oxidoreductase [Acidimicrobiia bacterium]
HTVPLLYLDVDGTHVVIASWGGRDYPPDWYGNLVADPTVTVEWNGGRYDATARTASRVEKERMWPLALAAYPGYAEYQSRTERDIPMVWLQR